MRRGFKVMRRAVLALFLRELKTRFGKYQLGYAWALIEPVTSTAVMLLVFGALGMHGYPGITFPVFLICGIVVNSLFVEITNRSIKAMEANSALFNYRPIRPVDTVISRAILEWMLHLGVLATLLAIYAASGGEVVIGNLPLLLAVFLLLTLFSTGVGVAFMLITDLYQDADKVLPLVTRPIFFISGVFFSLQTVPRDYWPLLLWNPIFHAIELAREASSPGYHVPQASLSYLAICALTSLTISLHFYRRQERRMRLR